MKKTITSTLLLFVLLTTSYAQKYGTIEREVETEVKQEKEYETTIEIDSFIIPQLIWKMSFTSLANIHPAVQFGFEHHLKNYRHAMYYEIGGFIPYNGGGQNDLDVLPVTGGRFRLEYRKYLRKKPQLANNRFLGAVIMPQLKTNPNEEYFDRGGGQFTELISFRENIFTNKLMISYGANRVGRYKKKLFFEWAVSAGIQTRTISYKGLPDDIDTKTLDTTDDDAELLIRDYWNLVARWLEPARTRIHPYVTFSMRIGSVIK